MRPIWFLVALAPAVLAAADPTAPKPVDPNKTLCRAEVSTGSRLGGARVCRTVAEWRRIEAESQKGLRDLTRRNSDLPHEGVR